MNVKYAQTITIDNAVAPRRMYQVIGQPGYIVEAT